jgi:hypothetical protein
MTKPYSLDLRERVIERVAAGRQRASRCHDLHGERGECGALVAAAFGGRAAPRVGRWGAIGPALSLENGAGSWSGSRPSPR